MKISSFIQRVNEGKFDELFCELYGGEGVAAAAERYLRALQAFKDIYPENDDISVFSTPGRTEIGGNHTDHNAGYVLAGAVNLDVITIASKTDLPLIRLQSEGFAPCVISLDELSASREEFYTTGALIRGVAARMRELGYNIGGFDAYVTSTIPNGAGLSSSAAFEVQMVTILNHLYNDAKIDAITNAQIAQYSENNYFGKPCGLMDQTTCSIGGLVQIDFNDFDAPIASKVDFDFASQAHRLYIVETGGSHADLNEDYTALENEMKQTARALGKPVLRFTSKEALFDELHSLRGQVNDRAILRAYHYFNDNERVLGQTSALRNGDFELFKQLITESGFSSFMYCQNVYANSYWQEQGVSIALIIAEDCLKNKGAWRVHGGGFAGTIQAFVPDELSAEFERRMSAVFGPDACHCMMIRPKGTMQIL